MAKVRLQPPSSWWASCSLYSWTRNELSGSIHHLVIQQTPKGGGGKKEGRANPHDETARKNSFQPPPLTSVLFHPPGNFSHSVPSEILRNSRMWSPPFGGLSQVMVSKGPSLRGSVLRYVLPPPLELCRGHLVLASDNSGCEWQHVVGINLHFDYYSSSLSCEESANWRFAASVRRGIHTLRIR